jgi:transketolase
LAEKEVAATRVALGWTYPPFEVPKAIYGAWDARERGARQQQEWTERFARYRAAFPAEAAEFNRRIGAELPKDWAQASAAFVAAQAKKGETVATRKASQQAIEALAPHLPEMLGGSADLTGSVFTNWSKSVAVSRTHPGNYVNFGVREFAMSAIANGIVVAGGFIPYVGTFLTFSDYARNALRMAALMKIGTIFVYTHDSIGLGEDGPTHQSIEHAASLRLIPQMELWRPCDTVETAVRGSRRSSAATARRRCCSRAERAVPAARRSDDRGDSSRRLRARRLEWRGQARRRHRHRLRGRRGDGRAHRARERGIAVRVVSMPCTQVFDHQEAAYRDAVLPQACRALPSRPAPPMAGASTSARRAIRAARRRHRHVRRVRAGGVCSSISASPPTRGRAVRRVARHDGVRSQPLHRERDDASRTEDHLFISL